jgi:hypothetical protein
MRGALIVPEPERRPEFNSDFEAAGGALGESPSARAQAPTLFSAGSLAVSFFSPGILMKKIAFSILLGCGIQASLEAQTNSAPASADTNGLAGSVAPTVVARTANSRVWARISSQTNADGQVSLVTNKAYTEVGANLCFQDGNGIWSDSVGSLAIVADGAASGHSPLAVHFAGDANAGGGTVRLTAPDGKVFVSKVYGLSYYDSATDTNVLIAPLQSTQGQLVGDKHICYPNAFAGLNADLWYTFSPSRVDQDIVLRESPPSPAAYGLNPQTTRLQVWTEWLNVAEPRQVSQMDEGIEHEAYLDWGNLIMIPGSALFTQGQADPSPVDSGPIYKHWRQIQGRDWLIEEVRFPEIANVLQALPQHASAGRPGKSLYESFASTGRLSPGAGHDGGGKPMVVAKNYVRGPSLVLDYITVSTVSNFTFQCDTTYFISSNVTMGGTNTVFEGGTILKYASNSSLTVVSPVTWLGAAYRPVIMTAKDDNLIGGIIAGSTGSPGTKYYANPALSYTGSANNTNLVINHWRVLNANTALSIANQSSNVLSHVQMVNCGTGIQADMATYSLWNALMYNVMTNFSGLAALGDVEHLTSDTANWLNNGQTLNLTNCLLVAVTNTGTFTSNSVYSSSSRAGIFQTVGGGAHYLAANSPYTNAGTTGINPALAAALAQMTTFPPVKVTTNISANTTLSPQAQRDTDTPDIGFHYDPLDFVWSNLTVNADVTLELTNGVAVGTLGTNGLTVFGNLVSQGTPNNLNYFGSSAGVQEQPVTELTTLLPMGQAEINKVWYNQPWQSVYLRFANLPMLGGTGSYFNVADHDYYPFDNPADEVTAGPLTLKDCQLHGGIMYVLIGYFYDDNEDESSLTVNLINNLLDRCSIWFQDAPYGDEAFFNLRCTNNLFHNGSFTGYYAMDGEGATWSFNDNLFDNSALIVTDNNEPVPSWIGEVTSGNNGYINTGPITNLMAYYGIGTGADGVNDQYPPVADYQTGALGNYYYPTSGGNLSTLIHAGDQPASQLGLYHYTITTNNAIEGTNPVSIGFHYVAVDANGNPLVSNTNGVPDYLADANGNGIIDPGEIPWANPPSITVQPVSQTVLQGTAASFSVVATGTAPLTYQWSLNGTSIAGANQSIYSIADVEAANLGIYTVTVTNVAGAVTSSNAILDIPIQFTISFTNQYVNLTNAPLSLAIQSGVPYYYAVLLDNTNFGGASWTAYTSSNITASLGANQGWHTVWVGLCGPIAGSQATWNAVRLDLDLTAPILVVTNNTSVTIPMIQLQGYANEELAWLSYDLNNANGSISNQQGFMTGAVFDTNSFSYTNNSFKCFDLALASGANTVTLHAADLAGNCTNCSVTFNVNYANKPSPVVQLYWPQNGAQISGSSFTWRGTVDDPTVTLSAQITDTNGDVNVVAGVIERNGNFWVDNIPLAPGPNSLMLTATDINNHVSIYFIDVVQSSVAMTINPITDNLNQSTVMVTGTISETNYTVWVNGVAATNLTWNGSAYSWTANNVPVNGAGCAVVQACAIPDTAADNYGNGTGTGGGGTNSSLSNPGNPTAADACSLEINQDKPAAFVCDYFHTSWTANNMTAWLPSMGEQTYNEVQINLTSDWSSRTGGSALFTCCENGGINGYGQTYASYNLDQYQWDIDGNGTSQIGLSGFPDDTAPCGTVTEWGQTWPYTGATLSGLQGQSCGLLTATTWFEQWACTQFNTNYGLQTSTSRFGFHSTSGRSLPGRQTLHIIWANALGICDPWYPYDVPPDPYYPRPGPFNDICWNGGLYPCTSTYYEISPLAVTICGGPEIADGCFWGNGVPGARYVNLPDGEDVEATVMLPSVAYCMMQLGQEDAPPRIYNFFTGGDVTYSNTTVIVGQQICLYCSNSAGLNMSNYNWSVPGTTESQFYVSQDSGHTNGYPIPLTSAMLTNTNGTVSFFWVDAGKKTVTCTAVCGGATNTVTTTFTVVSPMNINVSYSIGNVSIGNDLDEFDMNFGIPEPDGIPGIGFSNSLTMPPEFTNYYGIYYTEWVQLLTSWKCTMTISNGVGNISNYINQTVGTCLDDNYPYQYDTSYTSDSPSVPLDYSNQIAGTDSQYSQMWLMFKQIGGNWVPLWIVSWNCAGTATGFGSDSSKWSLSGTNISVSSSAPAGTTYPVWTNNAKNYNTNFP